MTEIHPTAIVDPGARLGENVRVGAYCVIGPDVEVGDGCWLQHHASLCGPSQIGRDNRFFPFASIGQQTQDLKYSGEPTFLVVGNENTFREFATVHRGTSPNSCTRIGDRGNFLAYSHIAHDCTVGDDVIISNNGTLAGHVEVGDRAVIGGLTAIHQFCRVGRLALTGGCSKIVQDVPPFLIADGNPAVIRGINKVGLERAGVPDETMRQLKEAYRLLYRSKLSLREAVKQMRSSLSSLPEIELLVDFVESSQRGIVR